jgi:hypothetical protein
MLGCTLAELSVRMTAHEYMQWQAFDVLDPIGSHRSDLQFAMLQHWLLQLHSTEAANKLSVTDLLMFDRYPADVDPLDALQAQINYFDNLPKA